MKQPSTIVLMAFIAGCAAIDRPVTTERLEPIGEKEFTFETFVPAVHSPDTALDWLRSSLEQNHMCANGFEITDRKTVAVPALIGNAHRVYYRGRCT